MSVDTMRWAISVLTALGFTLPAIGIGHTFWSVIQNRKARDRIQVLKADIDRRYQILAEDAKVEGQPYSGAQKWDEYRAEGIPFPTFDYQYRLVEDAFYGNVGERLSVAKKDLVFVFGGALSATVASIWSVWIPSGS